MKRIMLYLLLAGLLVACNNAPSKSRKKVAVKELTYFTSTGWIVMQAKPLLIRYVDTMYNMHDTVELNGLRYVIVKD